MRRRCRSNGYAEQAGQSQQKGERPDCVRHARARRVHCFGGCSFGASVAGVSPTSSNVIEVST
ncbi:MAG TPA: hypothetical protein VG345_03420, partial [Bryobacteraceae bacterium]|nr:hypothetical protein [Bryobacteraceae bacterium]